MAPVLTGFPYRSIGIRIAIKEVMEMEEKKEAGVSTWVWVIVIAIAAALVAAFLIFLRP